MEQPQEVSTVRWLADRRPACFIRRSECQIWRKCSKKIILESLQASMWDLGSWRWLLIPVQFCSKLLRMCTVQWNYLQRSDCKILGFIFMLYIVINPKLVNNPAIWLVPASLDHVCSSRSGFLDQGYLCSSKGWVQMKIGWSRGEFIFTANGPKGSPRAWNHQWKAEVKRIIHRSEWVAKVTTTTLWLFSCLWIRSKFIFCGFVLRGSPSACSRGTQQSSNHCTSSESSSYPRCGGPGCEYFCHWLGKSENWPSERRLNFSTQSKSNQQPGQGMKSQVQCEGEGVLLSFM